MGGRPMTALNIVGFPVGLPKDILVSVLRGGADKAGEAGVLIVGGHTVDDDEPKYGLAVTGVVKPGEQITCKGARVGDALILTKPIGTGVITTAGKQQRVEQDVLDDAVEVMSALNAEASLAMIDVGVHACTDITGFGLLGHLRTVLEPSRVAAVVHYEAVPLLRGAWDLAAQGVAPGGTGRNVESVADVTAWPDGLDEVWTVLLCDAQTSGGLLISVSPDKSEQLLTGLTDAGVGVATVVGEIVPADSLDGKLIAVRP
jgi:selenide,water dikinase